jgi:hypothetical protein
VIPSACVISLALALWTRTSSAEAEGARDCFRREATSRLAYP